MNNSICSIFCSFCNGEKFIENYIENILEQTIFPKTEFVFLNCCSSKNEEQYIVPLTKQYNNIKYYRLENDPGLYAGWNIAIKLCNSPIIGNWNIDDRKNKEGLEILLNQFYKNPSLDIVYGITYVSHTANEKYVNNSYQEIYPCLPHSFENLLRNNSPHCMPLWRRNLHDRFGYFDENYKTAADGDFWLRCAVGGARIEMINHPVGLYYHNPTGRSTDPEHLREMVDEVGRMRRNYIGYLKS
jgi:glycosyltransferase involved in cell wall biosynthesis